MNTTTQNNNDWIFVTEWVPQSEYDGTAEKESLEWIKSKLTMRLSQVVFFEKKGYKTYAHFAAAHDQMPALGLLDPSSARLAKSLMPNIPKPVKADGEKKPRKRKAADAKPSEANAPAPNGAGAEPAVVVKKQKKVKNTTAASKEAAVVPKGDKKE